MNPFWTNISVALAFLLVFPTELQGQSWELGTYYPKELPDGGRYASCPDSLLAIYALSKEASPESLYKEPSGFQSLPEDVDLHPGEILWLKASLTNPTSQSRRFLLEADASETDWSEVDIYLFRNDSIFKHIRTGNTVPPAQRYIRDSRNFFWWEAGPSEQADVLIRYKSAVNANRPPPDLRVHYPSTMQDFEGVYLTVLPKNPIRAWPVESALPIRYSKEFVIDTTEQYRFEELRDHWERYADHFDPNRIRIAVKHALWCRIKVTNPLDRTQSYFFTPSGDSPEIQAYLPDGQGGYMRTLTGKKVPLAEKQIAHHVSLLHFELPAGESGYVFLRYAPFHKMVNDFHTSYMTPILFLDRNQVLQAIRVSGIWKGFIVGIILFEIVYFVLRAIFERDRLWYYYLMVILGFLFLFIAMENIRNTFLAWQMYFEYNAFLYSLSFIFSASGLFLFSNRYLQLKEGLPWAVNVQRVILILIIGLQCAFLLQEVTGNYREGMYPDAHLFYRLPFFATVLLLTGLFFLFYIIAAMIGLLRHQPGAKSYLMAFAPGSLAVLYLCFKRIFVGRLSLADFNAYYAFSIASHMLFAIVVAQRNNAAKLKTVRAEGLIRLNDAKSRFYDHISHEFRTPLTVIKGITNMIDGHSREKNLIQRNSQKVLNLVDQLIGFSKTQASMEKVVLVEENVVPYLEYLVEAFQPLAGQKDIHLDLCYDDAVMEFPYDREKLKLILNNLLANAIKFTPNGGRVQVRAALQEIRFILSVQDNGIGIPEKERERIFDRYYRVKTTSNTDQESSGIGLALTRDLVNRLGGEIGVDSTIESGSIFTVTLPVQAQKHREIDVALSGTHTLENPDLPMLLLVEDHADVAYYLGRLLSGKYTIVTAKNGEEGLAKAQSLIPDLILSDVMMPKMDGYEMTAQLKSDFRTAHIPIILLTAKSRHEDKIEGLKGGADAYLVKPIAEDELLVRIQKLIETRQKLRDRYAGESLLFPKEVRQDPFLEKALDILENNYHEERFGIGEFASALHLSRMQVHRKLKALTGESASHFINRFRLEKGREMLILNHLNVSEVAYACGYSDPGYFGKLFSKAYGESPQHFQNTVQA